MRRFTWTNHNNRSNRMSAITIRENLWKSKDRINTIVVNKYELKLREGHPNVSSPISLRKRVKVQWRVKIRDLLQHSGLSSIRLRWPEPKMSQLLSSRPYGKQHRRLRKWPRQGKSLKSLRSRMLMKVR